jgi:predicted Zn-dependent peptidase
MTERRNRTVALGIVALAACLACAAAASQPVLAQGKTVADQLTYPKLKDIPVPTVVRETLPNGIKLLLVEDHDFPVVGFQAIVRGGMLAEPAGKTGLTEMVGTVLRSGGTATINGDAMDEMLDRLGSRIASSSTADSVRVGGRALVEHVDKVLPLFADVLRTPAFAQNKLDLAKRQRASSIARRNDNVQGVAQREFNKLLYGKGSPYARQLEYADLDPITRDDLVAYHARVFRPDQTLIAVFGDFKTDQMKARMAQLLGSWKAEGPAPSYRAPGTPPAKGSLNYIEKRDVTQTFLFLGHPGFRFDDPDYPAVQVMSDLLGGGFASRIFKKVRTEMGLAYGAGGAVVPAYDHQGFFFFYTATKPESTTVALRAILDEIKRIREAPVTDEELNYAKSAYLNTYAFDFDSKEKVIRRLLNYDFYQYPADFNTRVRNAVEKVTKDDVLRVAKKHLQPDVLSIVAVGIKEQFDKPLDMFGAVNTIDITIPEPKPKAPAAVVK